MVRSAILALLLMSSPVQAGFVLERTPTKAQAADCAANYLAVGTLINTKVKLDTSLDAAAKQAMLSYARGFAERAASVLKVKTAAKIPKPIVKQAEMIYAPVRGGNQEAHGKLMGMIGTCDAAFKLAPIVG